MSRLTAAMAVLRLRLRFVLTAGALLAAACGNNPDEGDVSGSGGKADDLAAERIQCGILDFVNSASESALVHDVLLSPYGAHNIVRHRDGFDGQPGTDDDDLFDSIIELDELPGVGPTALGSLSDFVESQDLLCAEMIEPECAPESPDGTLAVCELRDMLIEAGLSEASLLLDAQRLRSTEAESSLLDLGWTLEREDADLRAYTLGHAQLFQSGQRAVFYTDGRVALVLFANQPDVHASFIQSIELASDGSIVGNSVTRLE